VSSVHWLSSMGYAFQLIKQFFTFRRASGRWCPVPEIGAYADGVLSPQEAVDVPFVVCLKTLQGFQLFVDVWAQVVR
jgi:hypothetical protein